MIIRKRFDPKKRTGLTFKGELSLTKQSFKDECDINNILKLYKETGELPESQKATPRYGDYSKVPDYLESLNIVAQANEQFALLSAHVRARFDNNPEGFLAFATDPANGEEMVRMGLATARESKPELTPSPASPNASKGKSSGQPAKAKESNDDAAQ